MLPSVIEWYASRGIDVRKINSLEWCCKYTTHWK
jgi:hypothetical protein